ncbi:MAG: ribonuclease H family protein, partial [Mesorhizobium sp.]
MTGETNLQRLLASMTPQLLPDVHVFATLAPGTAVPDGLDPVMQFREREGLTLIVSEYQAKVAGLAGTFRCRMITL